MIALHSRSAADSMLLVTACSWFCCNNISRLSRACQDLWQACPLLQMAPIPHTAVPEWLTRRETDRVNIKLSSDLHKGLVRATRMLISMAMRADPAAVDTRIVARNSRAG